MLMLGRVRVLLLLLVRVVALVLLRRLARLRMRVVHGIGAVVRVRLQPLHSIMLLRSIPASASHRVTERMRLRLLRLLLRLLRCLHRLSELRLCERTCCVVIEAVICSVWLHRLLRLLLVVVRTMLRLGGCLSVGCGCRAVVRRMRCVCVCARWLRWRHVWWRRVVPHVVRCCASAVQCSAAAVCCWLCRSIRCTVGNPPWRHGTQCHALPLRAMPLSHTRVSHCHRRWHGQRGAVARTVRSGGSVLQAPWTAAPAGAAVQLSVIGCSLSSCCRADDGSCTPMRPNPMLTLEAAAMWRIAHFDL